MNDEFAHYDAIASALLSAGATMIAIVGTLVPVLKSQGALGETGFALYGLITSMLLLVIILSVFGLITKDNPRRKRVLCLIPTIPLVISAALLVVIIL